jgi:hypothetical protein
LQAFVALPLEVWRLAIYSVAIFIQQNFLQISFSESGPQILASRDSCMLSPSKGWWRKDYLAIIYNILTPTDLFILILV